MEFCFMNPLSDNPGWRFTARLIHILFRFDKVIIRNVINILLNFQKILWTFLILTTGISYLSKSLKDLRH